MSDQKNSLFRKEALERLSSPESLDRLMQVVSLKDWLPLVTLGGLVFLAGLWSIWGRIPITVNGKGGIEPSSSGGRVSVADIRTVEVAECPRWTVYFPRLSSGNH